MTPGPYESEWQTRKRRIDPKLDACGWLLRNGNVVGLHAPARTEEHDTDHGPADYALWLDGHVVGVVEAKKLTVGPQDRLTQAERYARGLTSGRFNFDGLRCPFLYSTNGEVIWFRDARSSMNRSRTIANFHTPAALRSLLESDFDGATAKLLHTPNDHSLLRPYQRKANQAIEQAIADRKRHLLVAMATGTGKTFTMVNQVCRLMQSGVAKRVLFLVDRRALAAQAIRAFSSFDAAPGQKFSQLYEIYSSRFHMGDFGEDEKFDPNVLPTRYLTDPQPGDAFVYVATIQRMAINVLGRQAIFGAGDEEIDEEVDRLDIPIHAFDVIVADEMPSRFRG
ncbi:MAG TPA: DEAD/DEAH box helicase family protein [Gemmatimonadaceae bacterium]|nr:DEAD/DEAH box helicase family protein [Gemmatimonadaceae bacterium]